MPFSSIRTPSATHPNSRSPPRRHFETRAGQNGPLCRPCMQFQAPLIHFAISRPSQLESAPIVQAVFSLATHIRFETRAFTTCVIKAFGSRVPTSCPLKPGLRICNLSREHLRKEFKSVFITRFQVYDLAVARLSIRELREPF